MTEEILKAAIMQIKAKATERFGIIKDLYHRPATADTADHIVQHSIALAQLEGALITLQQYAPALAQQTKAEEASNTPQEEPTPVEVEEEDPEPISESDLETRSATYRRSMKNRQSSERATEEDES